MLKYYIAISIAVLFTATAQTLLKKGALYGKDKSIIYSYLNVFTLTGYLLFFLATLFSLYALQEIELKLMIIFLPFIYILVGLFSYIFFDEKMTLYQMVGSMLIIIGVVCFKGNYWLS